MPGGRNPPRGPVGGRASPARGSSAGARAGRARGRAGPAGCAERGPGTARPGRVAAGGAAGEGRRPRGAARTWRSLLGGRATAQQQVPGQHHRRSCRLLGAILGVRCSAPSAAGPRRAAAAAPRARRALTLHRLRVALLPPGHRGGPRRRPGPAARPPAARQPPPPARGGRRRPASTGHFRFRFPRARGGWPGSARATRKRGVRVRRGGPAPGPALPRPRHERSGPGPGGGVRPERDGTEHGARDRRAAPGARAGRDSSGSAPSGRREAVAPAAPGPLPVATGLCAPSGAAAALPPVPSGSGPAEQRRGGQAPVPRALRVPGWAVPGEPWRCGAAGDDSPLTGRAAPPAPVPGHGSVTARPEAG